MCEDQKTVKTRAFYLTNRDQYILDLEENGLLDDGETMYSEALEASLDSFGEIVRTEVYAYREEKIDDEFLKSKLIRLEFRVIPSESRSGLIEMCYIGYSIFI
ncbi:hypothetical protein QUF57_03245 [Bacillus pumilus]|uniref:hypothetical protein n=1 Tax=Bacillus pumilus TaxID=1408 RepID=UPI0005C52282|nr:hypothetical protein [Bacillus pumilus]MDM5318996.1 hypothetical protein [Bacillus pumilus]MED4675639.1 hypothetical protein [Bacillus pumilus]